MTRISRGVPGAALLAAGCTGALLLSLAAPAHAAADVDLEARLHSTASFPHARGHAEYENEEHGSGLDISIAGLQALHGGHVTVRVQGTFVGSMTVSPRGQAHLERHSGLPRVRAGDVVRVRTAGGRLVTHGTFGTHSTHGDDTDTH